MTLFQPKSGTRKHDHLVRGALTLEAIPLSKARAGSYRMAVLIPSQGELASGPTHMS